MLRLPSTSWGSFLDDCQLLPKICATCTAGRGRDWGWGWCWVCAWAWLGLAYLLNSYSIPIPLSIPSSSAPPTPCATDVRQLSVCHMWWLLPHNEACIVEYEKCTKLKRIEGTTTEVNGIVSVHLGGALNSDHFQANDWHRAGSMSHPPSPTHFPRLPLFTSFLKCRHSPNPLTLLVAVATVDKQQQRQAATSVVKPSISDRYTQIQIQIQLQIQILSI